MIQSSEADDIRAAGYRVLRSLSAGGDGPWLAVRDAEARPVVIRVLSADADADASDGSVSANLCTEPVAHLTELLDIFTSSQHRTFLIEAYAERGPLLSELAGRSLSGGEAATVALALVECVIDAWAYRGIPATLTLGACVITSEGAVAFTRGSGWVPIANTTEVEAALVTLRTTLAGFEAQLPGISRELARLPFGPAAWSELVSWLRSRFVPMPILQREQAALLGDIARIELAQGEATADSEPLSRGAFGWASGLLDRVRIAPDHHISGVWGKIAFGAGVCVVATMGFLAILSSSTGQAVSAPSGDASPSTASTPSESDTATALEPVAIPSEPGAAAVALLAHRADCASVGVACLAEVDEPGSALLAEDQSLLADGALLRAAFHPAGVGRVVSDMGSAVLIECSGEQHTASVLLVQTEAAWMIREVFD